MSFYIFFLVASFVIIVVVCNILFFGCWAKHILCDTLAQNSFLSRKIPLTIHPIHHNKALYNIFSETSFPTKNSCCAMHNKRFNVLFFNVSYIYVYLTNPPWHKTELRMKTHSEDKVTFLCLSQFLIFYKFRLEFGNISYIF